MALVLTGSVGKGRTAENRPVDVQAVQAALIATCDGESGITGIAPTGFTCDPETVAAIIAYQKHVLKLPFPDGTITLGGTTHNMLNNSGKRWPGLPKGGAGAPGQPGTPGVPGAKDEVLEGARAQAGQILPGDFEAFEKWYREGCYEKLLKGIPGFFSRWEDGRRLFLLFQAFKGNLLALNNMALIVKQIGRLSAMQVDMLTKGLTRATKFTNILGRAAGRAELIGLFTLAMDIFIHGSRGNWGAAAGEVYKTVMNKAVPWAGMIEGLQSLVDALPFLEGPRKTVFFKLLRSIDPVGLGGAAPDALFSLIKFVFEKDPDQAYRIIDQAVERLKPGPTGILQPVGEALGGLVFELVHNPAAAMSRTTQMLAENRGPKW